MKYDIDGLRTPIALLHHWLERHEPCPGRGKCVLCEPIRAAIRAMPATCAEEVDDLDRLAASAMMGILAHPSAGLRNAEQIASDAYEIAWVMMKERRERHS